METIDRVLNVVVETQADVKDLKDRVGHVENIQAKTYDKLDGFLVLINRHEAELAAIHDLYERLEQRVSRLEAQPT